MFGLNNNNEADFALIIAERENFLSILLALIKLLKESGNDAQSEFVNSLVELINDSNYNQFAKQVNGVNIWGGAGAVWEVYIDDKNKAKEFEKEMLKLIILLEKTKIIGKGIKPIKKIFENNLR
jgi:hypothetical protein